MIGSIVFVVVILVAVVAIIIVLRKNCGVIKKGLTRVDKVVPLPLKIQFKVVKGLVSVLCPGDGGNAQ